MVVEHAYITVVPGQEDAFEDAFVAAQPILAGAAGCRSASLRRDAEHPGSYLLEVHWERLEDHLEVFPDSKAGKDFAAHVAHFFAVVPDVRHFVAEPVPA